MAIFSLVPYSIRLRKKGEVNSYLKLGKEQNEQTVDVLGFIKEYIENTVPNFKDLSDKINTAGPDLEHIVTDSKIITTGLIAKESKIISGIFRIGEHGYSAPLVNISTGELSYNKAVDEAELIPYYFLIKAIPTSDIGIVILQSFNNIGIKGVFFNGLQNSFKSRYPELTLEMNPFVPGSTVQEYLSNRIVEIKLVKHGYPTDMMDVSMDALPGEEVLEGTSEVIIKPPIRKDFPHQFIDQFRKRVDTFLDVDDENVENIIEVQNFSYDTAKIKVKHGEGYRTVDLGQTEKLKYSEELDGRVKIDTSTGHPSFSSIDELGKAFLTETATSIWGSNRDE